MTTFNQWRAAVAKKPEPRQITWLCGEETVLVNDVLTFIKHHLGPEPWNYVPLNAGEDSERVVWNELNQFPLGTSPRLVVIRNAEKLTQWDRFIEWIEQRSFNPRTYVVLISAEHKLPKTDPPLDERKRGVKPELLPHVAAIGSKGYAIECRPYTSATAKYSVAWVQSKVRMREGVAKHLLERSDFNLRLVRDVCVKLAVFPGEITMAVVNEMLTERPRDSFVDALLSLDKKTALLALENVQPDEYGRIIGLLDSRLDLAGMIHDMQSTHSSPQEIARAAGPQAWMVPNIMKVSKHYNTKRRHEVRKILAVADEAYQNGQRVALMEVVVAYW